MKKNLLPLLLILCIQYTIHAQWNPNPAINTPISTGAGKTSSNPWICKDGNGGYYIGWHQFNNTSSLTDIYLQHLDPQGRPLWQINGIRVTDVAGSETDTKVISDAAGGCYVVWQDHRTGILTNHNIYAQRYNATGTALWEPNGVAITTNTTDDLDPQVISDDAGGLIVCWSSGINTQIDVKAQRLDRNGTRLWSATGVSICMAPNRQGDIAMISDGSGGAIIAWDDSRDSPTNYEPDIYVQRVLSNGAVAWTADGVPVCTAPHDQSDVQLATDGKSGAILTWSDHRYSTATDQTADIYAQRVDANGVPLWSPNGNAVSVAAGLQDWPMIVDDDAGGAIICFYDTRNAGLGNAIYVQRMSADGMALWPQDGVPASHYIENVTGGFMVKDGDHGAIVAWQQNENASDIYAQRILSNGTQELHFTGYPVSIAPNSQFLEQANSGIYFGWMIESDGSTAVLAWRDQRDGNVDLYATKIFFKPALPIILNVKDQCSNSSTAIGKLGNPPPGTTITITQDGTPLTYNPADSSFIYFVNGATPTGNHTIHVEYSNISGGRFKDSVYSVTTSVTPAITITTNFTTICQNHTAEFRATATGGGTAPVYQWQLNGANVGTNSATWSTTTLQDGDIVRCIYNVDPAFLSCASSPSATSNSLTMSVTAAEPPTLTITSSDNGICPGTAITFNAVGTNLGASPSYHWKINGADIDNDSPVYISDSLTDEDEIICIVYPGIGACINTIVVSNGLTMQVHNVPRVSVYPVDTSVMYRSPVTLNATITGDYQSYTWTPPSGISNPSSLSPVISPADDVEYMLTVLTDDGCTIEKSINIKILYGLYIPTGFTPNDDGLNDVFRIPPRVLQSLKRFSIFNRWGNMVFTTRDLNEGWDGKIKGRLSDTGVYVYVIEGFDGTKNVYLKGTFTLIR